MNYRVIMKDGTEQAVTADTYNRVPPRFTFVNLVVKGGRARDETVLSVPIDDVTTILLAD